MSEAPIEKKDQVEREIDLIDLLRSIGIGIQKLVKFLLDIFLFLFVFGIRKFPYIAIFGLVGGGLGYVNFSLSKRFYSSEMVAQPNGFSSIDMASYINDIHDMCINGNIEGLQSAFQISEENARQIKNIKASYYIDVNLDGVGDVVDYKSKYRPEDTTQAIIFDRLLIRAEVFDNKAFEELKIGLLTYIDNNPYLLAVNNLRKEELRLLIEQANLEIQKLDSLQNFEYYKSPEDLGMSREGQLVFMNQKETQLYYTDKVSLLSRKIGYQKTLELATNPITIIKDFTELDVEENPVMKYILYWGFFCGLIGFLFLIILHFWKRIIAFLAKYR